MSILQIAFFIIISIKSVDVFKLTGKNSGTNLHHRMTKRELHTYFGVDSHDQVPAYDLVFPYQGDHKGNFASYKLDQPARHRRSTNEPNAWYFNIQALGLNLNLNLTKMRSVVGPKVRVETRHENGSITYSPQPIKRFLKGHVISEPGSLVTVKSDGGLTGMINLLDQVLFLHPLPSHLAKNYESNGGGKAHVVYRHPSSDTLNTKRSCHVEDSKQKRSIPGLRSRRSAAEHAQSSSNKILEVALIADKYVIEHKGEDKVADYMLMVAHILDTLYQDASIGRRKIHIKVVKLVLEKKMLNYKPYASNKEKIGKIADWGVLNIVLDNGKVGHADTLVLLSRGTSGGLAQISSTCTTQFGRTVNGDIGLATALIVAHEIAHTLGVSHDGEGAECPNQVYLMSSSVTGGKKAMEWSKCSREDIQDFLNGPTSSCLDNEPPQASGYADDYHMPSEYYKKLPGQIFDGKAQCQLQYGPKTFHCRQQKSNCGRLTCSDNGYECYSFVAPAMDGTKCGQRHWCIKGQCVDDGSPMIDGGWSEWSDYTKCSLPCGGGLRWKTRKCNNPAPQGGGEDCEGNEKGHFDICNAQDCPKGSKSFRQQQCEAKNPGSHVAWPADPCQLSCLKGYELRSYGRAADGSRCSGDPRIKHVCIQDRCWPVGCDNKLHSGVDHDRCGVCGGDSSTCSLVSGSYTKAWQGWGPSNPDKIVDLPVGSSNVFVKMKNLTTHLLGVQNADNQYLYNVGYVWSTVVPAAGTKVAYEHENSLYKDKIEIRGPTTEPLKIMYVGLRKKNPGVTYRFFAPSKSKVSPEDTRWETSKWTLCSEQCAGGFQTRAVKCIRKDDKSWVNDKMCAKSTSKPEMVKKCNTEPCPPSWYQSKWRPCSKSCGKGVQIREVVCRRKTAPGKFERVGDKQCDIDKKPKGLLEQDCNMIACPAEWVPTKWSKCSASCGPKGITTRSLKCKKLDENGAYVSAAERFCQHSIRPPTKETCNADINCPNTLMAPNGKKFVPLGCFRDHHGYHALPEMVANLRPKINWYRMEKTVQDCAEKVNEKNSTYKVFGVQFYGECWSGDKADSTYGEYGSSRNCWKGVGGSFSNYVYSFV